MWRQTDAHRSSFPNMRLCNACVTQQSLWRGQRVGALTETGAQCADAWTVTGGPGCGSWRTPQHPFLPVSARDSAAHDDGVILHALAADLVIHGVNPAMDAGCTAARERVVTASL